ncbi:MAG: hypothetical protein CVT48_02395 [Thermoplasmata archaeon HGW-Thermoplasmata-1]|nr:MAG: hypothetical protein CVT48_02395 [Thermoplasmata archaeon HGW-Thermoplasmata-1]
MDVLWFSIGTLVGIVIALVAVEFGLKKVFGKQEHSKLTSVWSLSEISDPLIVAEKLEGVPVPAGAKVVVRDAVDARTFSSAEVRKNPEVRSNFILGKNRALIFTGQIEPGKMALWTVDDILLRRLNSEFNRLWTKSDGYVEHLKIAELAGKSGLRVKTEGVVLDVIPYRERFLLRLSDHGHTIGVLTDKESDVKGSVVRVTGKLVKSDSGYSLIDSEEIDKIRIADAGTDAVQ